MSWDDVGNWLKQNAGSGAALVGSLLTGNIPGAVAAGVSMVSSATGEADPKSALVALQNYPDNVVKLKELAFKNEDAIRKHIEEMTRLDLEDKQKQHATTQKTIQMGDRAEDSFVRRTRPGQSWLSLIAALVYVFAMSFSPDGKPDIYVLSALLTLPWAYAGLRQVGKGVDSMASAMTMIKK